MEVQVFTDANVKNPHEGFNEQIHVASFSKILYPFFIYLY